MQSEHWLAVCSETTSVQATAEVVQGSIKDKDLVQKYLSSSGLGLQEQRSDNMYEEH